MLVKYLRYVLKHKWFVLQAGLKLGVPLWQLLVHDLSKFRFDELRAYSRWFYGYHGGSYDNAPDNLERLEWHGRMVGVLVKPPLKAAFDAAWLGHQHRNPHHWQHYVLREDSGAEKVLEMPERYRREMLADWQGAGRAITGKDDTQAWYLKNAGKIKLHPKTRAWVEAQLGVKTHFDDGLSISFEAAFVGSVDMDLFDRTVKAAIRVGV